MSKTKQKKRIYPEIKKQSSVKLRVAEQQAVYSTKTSSTQSKLPLDTIICGDALEVLKGLPDHFIDLIVTSPPYADI